MTFIKAALLDRSKKKKNTANVCGYRTPQDTRKKKKRTIILIFSAIVLEIFMSKNMNEQVLDQGRYMENYIAIYLTLDFIISHIPRYNQRTFIYLLFHFYRMRVHCRTWRESKNIVPFVLFCHAFHSWIILSCIYSELKRDSFVQTLHDTLLARLWWRTRASILFAFEFL